MQDWSKYIERPYREVLAELKAKGYQVVDDCLIAGYRNTELQKDDINIQLVCDPIQRGRRHHRHSQAGGTERCGQDGELHPKHYPSGNGDVGRYHDCHHEPNAKPGQCLRAPFPI